MESLGAYLKALREAAGISLSQVRDDILLKEEQIASLESDRLDDLGGYGIAKSIVYSYARYLEADVTAVMERFYVQFPEHKKAEFVPQRKLKEKKVLLSTNFLWMVGILIFVLILGSILYSAYKKGYLKAPDLFSRADKDSTSVYSNKGLEEIKPDTLRQKLLEISATLPNEESSPATDKPKAKKSPVVDDPTDYIGDIFADSPINITDELPLKKSSP